MTSSPLNLISVKAVPGEEGHASVGRFEHGSKFRILGMEHDDESIGGSSIEEPLFDEDQEISDVEGDEGDRSQRDIEKAEADQEDDGGAEDGNAGVPDQPQLAEAKRMR